MRLNSDFHLMSWPGRGKRPREKRLLPRTKYGAKFDMLEGGGFDFVNPGDGEFGLTHTGDAKHGWLLRHYTQATTHGNIHRF